MKDELKLSLLDHSTQQKVIRFFGLDKWSFRLTEKIEETVVRDRVYSEGKISYLLSDTQGSIPQLVFTYSASRRAPLSEPLDLWRLLFPSPFASLALLFETPKSFRLEKADDRLLESLSRWHEALNRLQERLCHTEQSVLILKKEPALKVLLSFNKHRLTEAKKLDFSGEQTPQAIKQALGVTATIASIPCPEPSSDALAAATTCLEQALETHISGGLNPDEVSSGYDLGL